MERGSIEELLQHRSWVRGLARSLVRGRAEADDLEQEGWLAAMEHPPSQPAAFRGWMRRVLKNRLANRRERDAARRRREQAVARPEPADELLDQLELQKSLAAEIAQLEEPYRSVVLLRYFEGLPPRRIAARLDVPVETVRTRLKRAHTMLRGKLARRHPDWRAGLLLLAWPPGLASAALGVVAVSTTKKITLAAVLFLVLGGTLAYQARDTNPVTSRGPAPDQSQAAIAPEVADSESEQTTQSAAPDALWVARGRTQSRKNEPWPGIEVVARMFAGYEAEGSPLRTDTLVSDHEGKFAWSIEPPAQTVTLEFRAEAEQARPAHRTVLLVRGRQPSPVTLTLRRLTAIVQGTVTDGDGRPLRDVQITTRGEHALTDSAGRYSLRVTESETQFVYALADGFAMQRSIVTLKDRAGTASFQLRPEFRITGRVVDPEGAPVEGATVATFFTMNANEARTDADGRYTLNHLDPGRESHMLRATHPRHLDANDTVTTSGAQAVHDVVLKRGVAVRGRLVNAAGEGVAGLRVTLAGGLFRIGRRRAVTRDDGEFAFDVMAPGATNLYVIPDGFAPIIRKVKIPDDFPLTLELAPGHSLAGTVVFEDGRPVADAYVTAKLGRDYLRQRSKTDAQGRWKLADLPEGEVGLEVYGTGFVRHDEKSIAVDRTDVKLTVIAALRVRGRVVDAVTGDPIDSFTIRIQRVDGAVGDLGATWVREGHGFAGTDGYWDSGEHTTFPIGATATIEARAEGYAPGTIQLKAGEEADKGVVRLDRGYTLSVVVTNRDGAPVKGAQVEFMHAAAASHGGAFTHKKRLSRTGADGRARIPNLAPGAGTLVVQHPDYAPHQEKLNDADPTEHQIRLIRGGVIHGRARANEFVELLGRGKTRTMTAGADGRFRFGALPPGEYFLCRRLESKRGVRTSYYRPVVRKVAVGIDETVEADLKATGTATLRGATDLPDGTVVILARGMDLAAPSTVVRDSRYEIKGLEPGEYTMYAPAKGRQVNRKISIEAGETKTLDLTK